MQTLRPKLAGLALSVIAVLGLSGCSALPSLEHDDSETSAGSCTSTVMTAQRAESSVSTGVTVLHRIRAAAVAASSWLDVATTCPQRFSEGVIRAAAAEIVTDDLTRRAGLPTVDREQSQNIEITGPKDSAEAATLAGLAVAQDRAGFAFEVLAARGDRLRERDETISLHHRDSAAILVASLHDCSQQSSDTCMTDDPREKIYSVANLKNPDTTIVDPTSGLSMPIGAAVEMDAVLEQLSAVTSSELDTTGKTALARFITYDAVTAFSLGYPRAPLPLQPLGSES